jgi:1-acyl-sn-glycerol-3-phosphate acyltransferase
MFTTLRCAFKTIRTCIRILLGFGLNNIQDYTNITRNWAQALVKYAKVKIDIHNKNNLPQDIGQKGTLYIYISNHASLFDIPVALATMPGNIRMIAKKELFKIPLFGSALLKYGGIPIDRGNRAEALEALELAKKRMCEGISVWAYPEGTRSLDGKLLPFKLGVFVMAKQIGATLIPVGLIGTGAITPNKSLKISQNKNVMINIGKEIKADDFNNPRDLLRAARESIEELTKKI